MIHQDDMHNGALRYPAFLTSELGRVNPDQALFHVIPVPYEKTVTYGTGTRKGPAAILEASQQLELYDGKGIPAEKGIYTDTVHSCGGEEDVVLDALAVRVEGILAKRKIPLILGGEHTITAGVLKGVARLLGSIGVIQFDAHADLRDRYEGSRYNHACVMRRVLEMGHRLFQIGTRSLSMEEAVYRKKRGLDTLDAEDIAKSGIPETLLPENFPDNVYLTIDVDCMDPSLMPATGTPEPGGMTWYQMMEALSRVCRQRKVIGFDIVELAPMTGFHAPDYTIARLIYQMMGLITE
ncbi:agmatinase [delta proteobacterium NaphS2]|nr:agmatinase [delta proteobacterium NaphS2]